MAAGHRQGLTRLLVRRGSAWCARRRHPAAADRHLFTLQRTGAEVIAIAGNHDHAATFDAYRPLMASAGITLAGSVRVAADGGVVKFTARSTGEPVTVALLPFLSQRYAVRAAQLVSTARRWPRRNRRAWR
ncbi:hypothetical protein SHIRM173S_08162 [Streptomyces hirsutus]